MSASTSEGFEEAPQANYGTAATIPTLDPELARQLGLPTAEDDDEALARPTDFSARIARNTQLQLQLESGTPRPVDPWGGSYYVERLTHDLAVRARAHLDEVESLGGMVKAIEAGPSHGSMRQE